MFELSCKICNEPFQAKTMFTKYCSSKCRMVKYRKTRKGKLTTKLYNMQHYQERKLQAITNRLAMDKLITNAMSLPIRLVSDDGMSRYDGIFHVNLVTDNVIFANYTCSDKTNTV